MKIKGTIKFKIKETHPDKKYAVGWNEDKVYEYSDVYSHKGYCTREDAIQYIKNDLALIAGGGYTTEHIEIVEFIIEEI